MPSRTPKERAEHYASYQSRPDVMKDRAQMNRARREMIRQGKAHKNDGTDVNHIKPLSAGGTSAPSNLEVVSRAKNRGYKRDSKNKPI